MWGAKGDAALFCSGVKPPETETVQSLPAEFNEKSTFTATVTPGGPNEFTFELKSN